MIEDTNRNVRTLIVSFVIAIMALIPLRFMELGESSIPVVLVGQAQVLGESNTVKVETEVKIEAPYDEIEAAGLVKGE